MKSEKPQTPLFVKVIYIIMILLSITVTAMIIILINQIITGNFYTCHHIAGLEFCESNYTTYR